MLWVESVAPGGWVIELSCEAAVGLLLLSAPVLGLYPLVPLLSELIPESDGMLVVSGVVGAGDALLVVSVGVVGVVGAALVVSVGVGLAGVIDVSLGCACDVVSKPPEVVSVRTAVVSPRSGAAPISSSLRLWQAASVAAAASM